MTKTFKEFVNEQDRDRPINHWVCEYPSAWGACAVGDYRAEVLGIPREQQEVTMSECDLINHPEAYEMLNQCELDYYGQLQDVMDATYF